MADLYAILGVSPDATPDEIKRAYRRKARELHPDTGGDEEAFKEVQHAYHVLSDPDRRARYDRFGDEGGARAGADPFDFGAGFGGIGDVIDAFFGGFSGTTRRRSAAHQPGRDVLVRARLVLEEVATGVRRPVEVDVATMCDRCGGTGSSTSAAPTTCATCGGSGQVQRLVRTAFGQLASATACSTCIGTGQTVSDPCDACLGEGRRQRKRTVTIDIPAGVTDGDRLRINGAGEAGRRGAPSGDLYLEVHVEPHDVFERDGRDLWCDVSVPFVHAALGAEVDIPTLTGEVRHLVIPDGSQPGEQLVLRGAGLPARGGGAPGDLHVRLQVDVPRRLTQEERELLERFAELRGEEVPPAGRSLFSRLREAFR